MDKEVVDEAGPNDLVILEFGANDLSWAKATPATWKADLKKLIARAKTKTDQILIMSPTPIGGVGKLQPEITKVLQELVDEEKLPRRTTPSWRSTGASRSPGPGWRTRDTPPTWAIS